MLVVFAAAIGFLLGGLAGAAWAVVILYSVFTVLVLFGG